MFFVLLSRLCLLPTSLWSHGQGLYLTQFISYPFVVRTPVVAHGTAVSSMMPPCSTTLATPCTPLRSNRDLDFYSGLNIDDDLLDHLGRRIQVDQSLVNPHLVHVPRLAAFATRCLSRGDFERLRGQADGTLDAQVLSLGALEQFRAHFLEGLHFAGGEGDADLVDFLRQRVLVLF